MFFCVKGGGGGFGMGGGHLSGGGSYGKIENPILILFKKTNSINNNYV